MRREREQVSRNHGACCCSCNAGDEGSHTDTWAEKNLRTEIAIQAKNAADAPNKAQMLGANAPN